MRIAIPTVGKDLDLMSAPIFGRAPGFLVVELENDKIKNYEFIPNPGASAWHGAGVAAAQAIVNANANVVITQTIGPNSFNILSSAGVAIFQGYGKVKDLIEKFIHGELIKLEAPNRGHFGRRWRNWS